MSPQRRSGRKPAPSAPDGDDTEAFRLVAIRPAATPKGCMGRDWLVYEIAQGGNVITGYRQGDLRAATADVEKIVVGLNERRVAGKGRSGPKQKTSAAAPPAAAAPQADGDEGAARGGEDT